MNNNMPTSPDPADSLDGLLREAEPCIADNGFTNRVLASLPPRRRPERLRLAVFSAAWLTGVVVLVLQAPTGCGAVAAFLQHAFRGELVPLLALAPMVFALGCLVWALTSWALEEWA